MKIEKDPQMVNKGTSKERARGGENVDDSRLMETERRMRERFSEVTDERLGASMGDVAEIFEELVHSSEKLEGGEISQDKWRIVFRSAIALFSEYPSAAGQMMDIVGQEPAILGAHMAVDTIADTMWRPERSLAVKERLRQMFRYAYGFGNINAEIAQELDFSHSEEYFRTGAFLEFLGRFFDSAQEDFLGQRGKDEELKKLFDEVIAENKGSYFLNARAKVLRRQMESGDPVGLDGDREVFVLAPGVEGKLENGELLERSMSPTPSVRGRTSPPRAGGEEDGVSSSGAEGEEGFHPVSYRGFVGTEEERQKNIFDYTALMRRPMRELIRRDLGVEITELSKEEQIFFLQFVKNIEAKDVERVRAFCQTFGRDGLRAFLSLEHGGQSMGEAIVRIGERFDTDDAKKIFSKYGEIVATARRAKEYVSEQFGEDRQEEAQNVEETLLRRGKDVLTRVTDASVPLPLQNLLSPRRTGEGENVFLRELEAICVETEVLHAVIQEEGSAGKIDRLQEMRDMRFVRVTGTELLNNVELLREVEAVYRSNHKGGEFADGLIARFRQRLGEVGSEFRVLLYKNEPQAFLLVSDHYGGKEMSALNTNPHFAFTQAGFGVFRDALAECEAKKMGVFIDCPSRMTAVYRNKFGFQEKGMMQFCGETLTLLQKDFSVA